MATLNELYNQYLLDYKPGTTVGGLSSLTEMKPQQNMIRGSDSGFTFSTPTKEQSEYAMDQGMTDVGENRFRGLGSMVVGGMLSAFNPALGMAYSLADPNSMTRQMLGGIDFGFTGTEGDFGSVATQAESEASMSEGMSDVGDSSGGVDSAGDGGDGYAYGGRVNYLQGGLISLLGNYYGKR